MAVLLGDEAPDFTADTTQGTIRFREWKQGRWAMLMSHPGDFTPVCTTELAAVATLMPEFEKRNTRVIAVSVDPLDTHYRWLSDVEELAEVPITFPLAADPNRWVSGLYGMVHPSASGRDTVRSVFIIDPDDRVRVMLAYPPCTGRNFEELLRVLDSLQLADKHQVVTPAGWQNGQDVLISTDVSNEEARTRFPKGFEAKKPYLRFTPQPDE